MKVRKDRSILAMATCMAVAAVFALVSTAGATEFIHETFNHATGNLVGTIPETGLVWVAHSGAGSTPVLVVADNCPGGALNAGSLAQGSGTREDCNSTFAGGEVAGALKKYYAGFWVKVGGSVSGTGVYFAHFSDTGTSVFTGRVGVTTPSSSGFRFCLWQSGSTIAATYPTDYAFNSWHQVVASWAYDTGGLEMWIDPNPALLENDPLQVPKITATVTGDMAKAMKAYALRQATGDSTTEVIDNLIVASTFAEVVSGTPPTTGACCVGTTCVPGLTASQCAAQPGTFLGLGSTCDSSPCTPGACCVDDGFGGEVCQMKTASQCATLLGFFQGPGTSCTPVNPCGPVGACCPAGFEGCVDNLTTEECQAQLPGAIWHEGEYCSVVCGPTGSCCKFDDNCLLDLTEMQCLLAQGHQWTEGASTCVPTCVAATAAPLIISEYYESAPGNRKAIEIYNTSATAKSLNGHALLRYANACTGTPSKFFLDGRTIDGYATLVFINDPNDDIPGFNEAQAIVAPGVIDFNGDDAIALVFGDVAGTPTTLDVFAVPCQYNTGPRGPTPYDDQAWERACSITTGTADFDACNFDGMKDCATAPCPHGTPYPYDPNDPNIPECTVSAHANEWVFEGLNPSGNNAHHTLGSHPCATGAGACCISGSLACACPGDVSGDSAVTTADIPEFVRVLLGAASDPCADANVDGYYDGRDVQRMVELVLAGTCGGEVQCFIMTAAECSAAHGSFQGVGTTCNPNPCGPTGSCCQPSYTCTDGTTAEECLAIDRTAVWTEGGTCAATCSVPVPPGFVVNEFWADDGGADSAEYIELYCPSCGGATLTGMSVIVVEGDVWTNPLDPNDPNTPPVALPNNFKKVIARWDLAGVTMPVDRYLVIGGGTTPNVDISFSLGSSGYIQNGSQTYAIVLTRDIAYIADPNNPTRLTDASVTAITAHLVDAIAETDDLDDVGHSDATYFGAPVLQTNFGVDTASRIPNGVDTNLIGDWVTQDNYLPSPDGTELFSVTDFLSSPGTQNTTTPVGACCVATACSSLTKAACDTATGEWLGRVYPCGNPDLNPCIPFGACCLPNNTCVQANQTACLTTLGGIYVGDGASCTPLPCGSKGSCCHTDWTCEDNVTQEQCTALSATATWKSGTCAVNCVQPIGACCVDDECSEGSTITACVGNGGIYQGDGTTCAGGCRARPCLIISEVVDGQRPLGTPKWIEITNTGTADYTFLAGGIIIQSNAATDFTVDVPLAGKTIVAGDSYVVCSDGSDGDLVFLDTYGFDADLYDSSGFGNGDDRYILTNSDTPTWADLLDIYGEFGVDGSGTGWEYTDGYALRASSANSGNLGSFLIGEWSIWPNTLGGTDPEAKLALQTYTTPGVHVFDSCGGSSGPTPDRRITGCPPDCPSLYCLYQVRSTADAVFAGEPGLGSLDDCLLDSGLLEAGWFLCIACPGANCGTVGDWVLFEWVNAIGSDSCYFYAQVFGQSCSGSCTGQSGVTKFKTVAP